MTKRNLLIYIGLVGVFTLLVWLLLDYGQHLDAGRMSDAASLEQQVADASARMAGPVDLTHRFSAILVENVKHPLSLLLLQIATVVLFARVFGVLLRKIGQPSVIGEIIAGIVLGPSVLGLLWPEFNNFLFRPESLGNLNFLSKLGVILYMFIVGLELEVRLLRHQASAAITVSHVSIVFPFFLGVALAYALVEEFAPPNVPFLAFALFMGCAMSITAFPVLARILKERAMTHTPAGALAISCAAIDDVTAWCLLASVIAIIKADGPFSAIFTVALSVAFVLMMLLVARPLLRRFVAYCNATQRSENTVSAVIFVTVFLAAFCTDVIGIHPLFGAFLAGVIVPPDAKFRERLATRIEYVCLVLLLPLFFAYTGLKTQIGLLDSAHLWFVCGLIILAAVTGKFAGSVFAARITGQSWQDACTVGALMNTRGLMELIVLNIGYELGILSPIVFSMMVLMAVVTTFMTCPALSLIAFVSRRKGERTVASPALRSP